LSAVFDVDVGFEVDSEISTKTRSPKSMRSKNQIRSWRKGWRQVGLSSLLCLAVHARAMAQTQTPVPPATPPPAAAAPAQNATTKTTKPKTAKPQTSAQPTTKRASTHKNATARTKKVAKKRGQQAIDPDRARDIQTALIREHYIQGEPSGTWDSATQAAMQRYQADHGWQAKTTPDARALIKLGLGPSHDHLLNPESAMTTTPTPPAAGDPKAGTKQTPADGFPQQ
jgi:hypothetical protein